MTSIPGAGWLCQQGGGGGGQPPASDAEATERLRAILASPEFHPHVADYLRGRLEALVNGIFHWLAALRPWERWTLLAFCLVSLAAIGVEVWLSLRPETPPDRAGPRRRHAAAEVRQAVEALVAQADGLAREGRWREAARLLHEAALLKLARERGLPWRPELADWEWVAALPGARGLEALTRAAQRVAWGTEPDAAAFAACRRSFDALFIEDRARADEPDRGRGGPGGVPPSRPEGGKPPGGPQAEGRGPHGTPDPAEAR